VWLLHKKSLGLGEKPCPVKGGCIWQRKPAHTFRCDYLDVYPRRRLLCSKYFVVDIHVNKTRNAGNKTMPKIELANVPERLGSGYPSPYDLPCANRVRRRLGEAGGLTDFGINLMVLPPGGWSSQRHWHSHEDEFVYLVEGELLLKENDSDTVLVKGDFAAFPKGHNNGHHLINQSSNNAIYLEIGSRQPDDVTTCSDIDLMSSNRDGRFVRKNNKPHDQ